MSEQRVSDDQIGVDIAAAELWRNQAAPSNCEPDPAYVDAMYDLRDARAENRELRESLRLMAVHHGAAHQSDGLIQRRIAAFDISDTERTDLKALQRARRALKSERATSEPKESSEA